MLGQREEDEDEPLCPKRLNSERDSQDALYCSPDGWMGRCGVMRDWVRAFAEAAGTVAA